MDINESNLMDIMDLDQSEPIIMITMMALEQKGKESIFFLLQITAIIEFKDFPWSSKESNQRVTIITSAYLILLLIRL